MITLKEVQSKKDLKTFIKFPFKLYKDSKYWTPPIISQEIKTFNKKENPVFNDADARLFLAYKNNEVVGRVAAIVNWLEIKDQNVKKMRFGWLDFIDDIEVSKALLNKVEGIGKSYQLEYTEGPVGFSNLDKVGVLTEGFDSVAPMVTWYNHPYYAKHYEAAGYAVEKSYIESRFYFSSVNPDVFTKANDLIKRRYQLEVLNFTKTEQVMPYTDKMFDLFNETYASLASFVAINDIQKAYFKKKFISFINPEYIKFIIDKNKNLVAFTIVMPYFATALQRAKGKLFPFGFKYILDAKKNSKNVVFYLIGVHPDYQNKGLNALIFNEYYKVFNEKGIETCYRTPELEDNEAIQKIWRHFNPEVYKRRKTFRKNLV
ncbi:GTP cyclohydrolase [Tamlana fucoidanivorans]|uniref:GTP cyclohydrolase n=1 Tax=Allotamlana fucoidanivorans TaxID=2583814 RepID=A0A5C4SQF1_9FLAO|nr:GTP cyclohydrolase [Tamlana fucoidanivorans]TNJ46502.1 GTP cyclohydrolase [Tamlana fucoidanivorans]